MKIDFTVSTTPKGSFSILLFFELINIRLIRGSFSNIFNRKNNLIVCFFVFTTQILAQVNDEPCNAILLPNPTEACHFYESSNVGYTPTSLPTLPTSGVPTGGNCYWSAITSLDAWFKVIVPDNGMIDVSIDKTLGLVTHIFAVYKMNPTCNALTAIQGKPSLSGTIGLRTCAEYGTAGSTPPFNMYSGLTPGDTLYIRVWNKSTASPGEFGICVSTPINDDCANPTYLCDLNGYTGITSTSYTVDTPDNITSGGVIFFTNTIENNAWFAFVARDTSITIHVDNYCEGSGQAMQMVIYEATNCTNFIRKGVGFSETVAGVPLTAQRTCKLNCDYTASGLIPGNTYYLMTDGASNALCHYTLTVNSSEIFTVDAGADTTICIGTPFTLNAYAPGNGSTFFWKQRVGGVLSDIGTNASHTINPGPTQTTTYIVEVTGGSLCSGVVDSVVVTVSSCDPVICPTATISYVGSPWCTTASSQNVALTGTGVYTGGKYTSSPVGLVIDSISGVVLPNISSAGSYLITYTIAPTATCSTAVIATTNVVITAAPSAMIGYTSSVFCTSLATAQPVSLSGTGSYTGGSYSSTPSGLTLNGTTGAIIPSTSNAQLYTITYIYPASGGCAAGFADTTLTITAIPTANITYAASPYCSSVSSAQMVSLTGTSGGTYSAGSGLSLNTSTGSIVPSTSIAGNYVVTYNVASAGGCPAVSDTANIVITAAPSAMISYTSSVFCTSLATAQPVSLSGTGSYTGGLYSSTPPGLTLNGTTGAITPSTSNAQLYTITYIYPASGGCAAGFADTTLTITAIPTANITYAASPYCSSVSSAQMVSLTGTSGGTYSAGSGLTLNTSTGSIVPSTSIAGNYVVTYNVASAGGCPAVSDTANIVINGLPSITISGNNSICKNESTVLLASGADLYIWSEGSTTNSITVNPLTDNTYSVTGTLFGCTNTSSYLVTVKPLPIPVIAGNSQLCIGDSISLTASGATSYVWSPGLGLSSTTTASVLAFPQASSLYKVVATLNDCVDSTTIQILVNPLPILQIASNIISGCEPLPVSFTVNSTPAASSANWNFGNGSTSSSLASNTWYLNDGTFDVSVNVTDVNGCSNSLSESAFIVVYPKPVINFSYTPSTAMVGENVLFSSSYTQSPATWFWFFGDGNSQTNPNSTANYTYSNTGELNVMHVVETEFGCRDTINKPITVITKIVVPNVLTPNNDGFNDTFKIDGLQFVEGAEMKIYNRWGNLIFESSNYNNNWDGENHAEGVYFFVLTLPDYLKVGPFSGSVTLFR